MNTTYVVALVCVFGAAGGGKWATDHKLFAHEVLQKVVADGPPIDSPRGVQRHKVCVSQGVSQGVSVTGYMPACVVEVCVAEVCVAGRVGVAGAEWPCWCGR
jgi:hypothetical protein